MFDKLQSFCIRIVPILALAVLSSSASAQLVCNTLAEQGNTGQVNTQNITWQGWGTGCYYVFQGRTNQSDPAIPTSWFVGGNRKNSRLCGPTSYSNALLPLFQMMWVNGGSKSSFSSWQLWLWDYWWKGGFPGQLLNVARKVKGYDSSWTPGTGGFPGCGWDDCQANYQKFRQSFSGGTSAARQAKAALIDTAYLAGGINKGRSDVLQYNFKKETCSITTSGTRVCKYAGGGSHTVAVSGYYDYAGVRYIRVMDPGGGVGTDGINFASPMYYSIKQITKVPTSTQPWGANTRILMSQPTNTSGVSTVWVIDDVAGVDQ
jgi:hypothetical protein